MTALQKMARWECRCLFHVSAPLFLCRFVRHACVHVACMFLLLCLSLLSLCAAVSVGAALHLHVLGEEPLPSDWPGKKVVDGLTEQWDFPSLLFSFCLISFLITYWTFLSLLSQTICNLILFCMLLICILKEFCFYLWNYFSSVHFKVTAFFSV